MFTYFDVRISDFRLHTDWEMAPPSYDLQSSGILDLNEHLRIVTSVNHLNPHLPSDLGLHCLSMSQKWDARLIWVKQLFQCGFILHVPVFLITVNNFIGCGYNIYEYYCIICILLYLQWTSAEPRTRIGRPNFLSICFYDLHRAPGWSLSTVKKYLKIPVVYSYCYFVFYYV